MLCMNFSPLISLLSSHDRYPEICYQLIPLNYCESFYEACCRNGCQEPAVLTEKNKCFLLKILRENCINYAGIAYNKVLCANGDVFRYQPNNPCCPQPEYVLCQKKKYPPHPDCDSSGSICDNLPLILLLYCLCCKHENGGSGEGSKCCLK